MYFIQQITLFTALFSNFALRVAPGLSLKTTMATTFADKPTGEKADAVRAWYGTNPSAYVTRYV